MKEEKGTEKSRALDLAMQQIEKSFGREAIMKLGQKEAQKIEVIPTGSLALDISLGVGGVPRGRVVEIYGPESSGKTTLSLHVVANAQKAGGTAAFIDAEHALDAAYAGQLGVDVENLLIAQPDSGEQALEIVEKLVRSGALDVIVVDSVAALVPKAEIEGEMGDAHVGLQARLMSQALRKLTGLLSKTKTTIIFINQIRHKIGVMFGSPETTTGGLALKFYATQRLDIRRIETIKQGETPVGSKVRVKIVKNKVAPPYRTAEFEMIFGKGFSREGELVDMGLTAGVLERSGTWYLYKGDRLGQGRENAKAFLAESPNVAKEIEDALKAKYMNPAPAEKEKPAEKAEKPAKAEAAARR